MIRTAPRPSDVPDAAPASPFSPKPSLSKKHLAWGSDSFRRLGSMSLNRSLSSSTKTPKTRRGVQICEDKNDILEISTRVERVERGDLDLFYRNDYVPDPVIECAICSYEAESDQEAGAFRIFNLPDGAWQLLCKTCEPPSADWAFDRTVAVVDALLPSDLLQLVYLYLPGPATRVCAQVCKEWGALSWTVLTLRDDSYFLRKLSNEAKLRHVWVLRVILEHPATADAAVRQLGAALGRIEGLAELQLTGLQSDAQITRIAQALRAHSQLQALDLRNCRFTTVGLQAILSALEENEAEPFDLILPQSCLAAEGRGPYSSRAAAQEAAAALVSGTQVVITVV